MKRQYLGDSKDSFKWDYHHYLVEALGYSHLKIAWMMTPDDNGPDGNTAPELFPARQEILNFCNHLRSSRDPGLVLGLPATTGAQYKVSFHEPNEALNGNSHNSFFAGIETSQDQVIFLDPDNGFEPERSSSDKHVRYSDLDRLIKSISPYTVVTVFQHHRRKKFPDDFARIRERLLSGYSTAIYWHSLMFVSVSSSPKTIHRVRKINREYEKHHPVKILA
ncbi:MAG: hypothetical protein Q8L89_08960 [Gammaproteobacteria bacterium]|nr:hypothetical protein [Gammaproteobacteria bacterium]